MKKIVAILLVLVMIVSMAACKKTPTDVVDSDPSTWPVLKMNIAPAADMHNQQAVQDKVNWVIRTARDVIANKYGKADDRKAALGIDYDLVQQQVNRMV